MINKEMQLNNKALAEMKVSDEPKNESPHLTEVPLGGRVGNQADNDHSELDRECSAKQHSFELDDIIDNIKNISRSQENGRILADYISAPFNVLTPKEKIKKRPDGFDYVESSFMDHVFKEHAPLSSTSLLYFDINWTERAVSAVVSLTNGITGNKEIGGDSAKIFNDVGNSIKSAISKAIKNAQSKFGVAADVYQKRESIPTDDERKRFDELFSKIKSVNPQRASMMERGWQELGTDWAQYLDSWSSYISKIDNADSNINKLSL